MKSKVAPAKKTTPVAKPAAKTSKAKAVVVKNQDLKPAQVSAAPVNKEKAPVIKAEKAQKIPTAKPAKPVVKKSIVAPITFRQEDPGPAKFMKEPNGKFEMEFVIRASEDMVFEFVSTESGLSEWFCDDVTIRNGVFTFSWDGQEQQAKLVKELPPSYIRYQWMDKNDGSYFEFKTQKDELTNDISLIITDFASDKSDEDSARLLWNSQVDKLLHVLGSFF
ncbi:MAG: START-like domain-containing protein [Bacteroidia bacterium]|nr:START-like domain-containing protein [Bacteroidia bacterium]